MPPPPSLTPASDALEMLSATVAASPADATALALVETVRTTAGGRGARAPRLERQVLARVVEAERPGAFRAFGAARHELAEAVRHAMARARAAERRPGGVPLLPGPRPPGAEAPAGPELHDPRLVALDGDAAQSRLRGLLRGDEAGRLSWWEVALTVVGSGGVARHLRATGVALEVRGRGGAHGHAAGAARTLQGLDAESIVERARRRAGTESADATSAESGGAVLLSAEAAAALVAALGPLALSASEWEDPLAYPARHSGARCFAPELDLVEDAARTPGLPFPLGIAGGERATAALVAGGILRGPVADPFEAEALGVPATSPFWTGEPGSPEHLHLPAGGASEEDLLRAAGDGIFVGEIERVACFDRGSLAARIATRGRRRIAGGALGGTLPPAVWEVDLPAALGTVLALGRDTATLPVGPFGGVTAPALALAACGAWRER